jgi:hypothetical protein
MSTNDNKPPRKDDEYYGTRYSVPVLAWDNNGIAVLNLVRWDYLYQGWVCADFANGPYPADYILEVAKWAIPPTMTE